MNEMPLKKVKKRFLSYLIAYSAKFLLRILLCTCQFEVRGLEEFIQVARKQKCILMLWHNRLALVAEILEKFAPYFCYVAFVSNSRDGEPLAILANSYKIGKTIRVPHDARHKALRKMINHLKHGKEIVIITPDGPKGPRYKVKPGVAMAARESQAKIIPLTWTSNRFWQLKTWDKLLLPKPFSKIVIDLGNPISFEKEAPFDLDQASNDLQNSLSALEQQGVENLILNPAHRPK